MVTICGRWRPRRLLLCCFVAVCVADVVRESLRAEQQRPQQQQPAGAELLLPDARPPLEQRRFASAAVDQVVAGIAGRILDRELAQLFANCLPNTLDTTVLSFRPATGTEQDEDDDSFVVTGDIQAMCECCFSLQHGLCRHRSSLRFLRPVASCSCAMVSIFFGRLQGCETRRIRSRRTTASPALIPVFRHCSEGC